MELLFDKNQRYIRNIAIPEIGSSGQEKLLQSRVLVVGAGGLGSAVIYYLAAAGIGKIGVVDDDIVDLSNLQRQIIHNQADIGRKKVVSAKEKINLLNQDVEVEAYQFKVDYYNLSELVENYDFVVDATDNFHSRFIINQVCYKKQKVLIFGAVKGFLGQVSVFKSYQASCPCFACFNPNIVEKNFDLPLSEKGILGAVAGAVGSIQSIQVVKEILDLEQSLVGKILSYDFLSNNFRTIILKKNINCQICSN